MKTMLYTGYDDTMAPLGDLTAPLMMDYAHKHGMDFSLYRDKPVNSATGIYWIGVYGALRAFKAGYDRAIYLDADQTITNMDFELPEWLEGFHASRDWGEDAIDDSHFSMCGFSATQDVAHVFRMCKALEDTWRERPFPEQGPMQHIYKEFHRECMHIHPIRLFNCVPEQMFPGKVVDPWKPGDWCAHLTHLPIDERIKVFHELKS